MDIENIDNNTVTEGEDMVLAGITLLVRTLFEDWARDLKEQMLEMIRDEVSESDIITDLQDVTNKLSDESVSAAQMHEAIANITNVVDEDALASLVSAQGTTDSVLTDIRKLLEDYNY